MASATGVPGAVLRPVGRSSAPLGAAASGAAAATAVLLVHAATRRSRLARTRSAAPRVPFAARQRVCRRAVAELQLSQELLDALPGTALETAVQAASETVHTLLTLLGPPQPAAAFEFEGGAKDAWSSVANFFFDPRLQWDENGNILLDPQGNPLPDNLWTQFVAVQATVITRIDQAVRAAGVPGSFGVAVALYTLMIRALLFPFVKGQLETTAKIQVLAPRVNELKEKYKDNQDVLNQEVGLLYMDLQIDPLGAVAPLLLQLPVFWGLYRAIRRLGIVKYSGLQEGFLWIPSLYGPNFTPDPSFKWLTEWQGPLIDLHPIMGWTDFGLYSILPLGIFISYRVILAEAFEDKNSSKILQFLPFLLAFITSELPQGLGIYIATNIASSLALTSITKAQIASRIPGYDEFVKTGKWPPGVDPEKVLAKAFGVKRLTEGPGIDDPASVPEAVFGGRADFIPELLARGRSIDEFDNRGIPASAYSLALDNQELLDKLFELGADPKVKDKRGNTLLHYVAGYGRSNFFDKLMETSLKDYLNEPNLDGQTPLDVARVNLGQEKVCDDVRKVIQLLEPKGAEGKQTTKEDEARFEEARERKKREESINAARSALKALAMAASKEAAPASTDTQADASASTEVAAAEAAPATSSLLVESLDRVKALDIESLKARLGGKLTDEQLEKLSKRLASMSPEELAAYAAGLPMVKAAEKSEATAAAEQAKADAEAEAKKVSVMVD